MSSLDKLFRRNTDDVKVTEGPLLGVVKEITIKTLTLVQLDHCDAAAYGALRRVHGDHFDEFQDHTLRQQKAAQEMLVSEKKAGGEEEKRDPKKIRPMIRVRSRGLYPPEVVLHGLAAVDGEPVPADREVFREKIDEMGSAACAWIALKICQFNGVIDDDPPTGSEE